MNNKGLINHINNVFFVYKPQRKWKNIYWLIDVHGVIIPGSWRRDNTFEWTSYYAPKALKILSDLPSQKLILWTSSYQSELNKLTDWFKSFDVNIDFINENPLENNTEYADFSKKPYFNILLDDKAGFDPVNWIDIYNFLISVNKETLQ